MTPSGDLVERLSDPDVIYLAPKCQEGCDGRQWCRDDVWSGGQADCDQEGCEHKPTKYVRADALAAKEAECVVLREAPMPPDAVTRLEDVERRCLEVQTGGYPWGSYDDVTKFAAQCHRDRVWLVSELTRLRAPP